MVENFQAVVGARIADFKNKMKEVNRQIQQTATGAVADIGANVSSFMAQMALIRAMLQNLNNSDADPEIDADTAGFWSRVTQVRAAIATFARTRIIIPIEARIEKFQKTISRIATNLRAFQELGQNTMKGTLISISPAIVPILAAAVGLIGALGPMIGVVAGSTFALVTAIAAAGIGFAAFGAMAIPTIKKLYDENAKLNEQQQKARGTIDQVKATYQGLVSATEKPVLLAFTKAMNTVNRMLITLEPLFVTSAVAVDNLMTSLGKSMETPAIQSFFEFLNKNAAPLLETIGKSFGNFTQGIFSMMTAFGPLAIDTANGFLKMSEGFATWAEGLTKSEKFQSFVTYIQENMPKIRSIFSDALAGITYFFSAFGPLSSDMMTSLQGLMERFKAWSQGLSENQGFQNFITYIRENAPAVVALIGNIVDFLVNLGIALAPAGAKLLEIANTFLAWTNSMMENHPWLGKILAGVIIIGGALLAAVPNIIAFHSLFGGMATGIMASTALMRAKFVTGMTMMVTSMAKAATKMVVSTATFVAKWTVIAVTSLLQGAKAAGGWLLATGASMVTALAKMAVSTATFVAKWVLIGAQSMIQAAKVAAAWVLSTGASMASSVGKMIATSAVFVAKWVWMGVQALAQAARMAAAWFIALGPIGWVIAAVVALAILIIANWDKIKAATARVWKAISDAVKKAWDAVKTKTIEAVKILGDNIAKMPGKVKEFASKMLSAGKDLVMGLINGIKGMAGDAIEAISGVVGGVIGKAKSLLKIKSPSRVFMAIGDDTIAGWINGMNKRKSDLHNSVYNLGRIIRSATAVHQSQMRALQNEENNKIKKVESDKVYKIKQIQLKASAAKRKLTAAESAKIVKIEKDARDKIAGIHVTYDKKMSTLASQANANKLEDIKNFISKKKELEEISIVEEAVLWGESVKAFKNGTDEKKLAQIEFKKALKKVNDDIVSINEDFSNRMKSINDNLIGQTEELTKAYQNAEDSRAKDLQSTYGLFDEVESRTSKSGQELTKDLQDQVTTFAKWQREIANLGGKNIDLALLDELRKLGPDSLPELQALNSMTDTELTQYSNLYQSKMAMARQQSVIELDGMKKDTANKIVELRKAANAELAILQTDWTKALVGITKTSETELTSLKQVGKNAATGLMNGLSSMKGPLVGAAKSIAESIKKTMSQVLDIHSPSRWMRDMIGKNTVQGIIVGMDSMKSNLIKSVVSLSDSITDSFNPQLLTVDAASLGGYDGIQSKALKTNIESKISAMDDGKTTDNKDVVLNVDGYELARVQRDKLDDLNGKKLNLKRHTRGRKQ